MSGFGARHAPGQSAPIKWFGVVVAIAALCGFVSMYPGFKRYINLERM